MPFEVQHYTLCDGWVNCWTISEGNGGPVPHTFPTREAAQAELNEVIAESVAEYFDGVRVEPENPSQYQIVEIEGPASDCSLDLIIHLEGGLVQSVISRDPVLIGRTVQILDYDTEGADENELVGVAQGNGNKILAYVRAEKITESAITIDAD